MKCPSPIAAELMKKARKLVWRTASWPSGTSSSSICCAISKRLTTPFPRSPPPVLTTRSCKHMRFLSCILLSLAAAVAQTIPPAAFEAASIKPSAPDARNTMIAMPPGGRLEIGNMTLKEMIASAYRIQTYQISGGPAWLDSIHYDISAKSGKELKRDDVLLMLQALLIDRFHLAIRREVRQLPVYALVLAHDPKRKRGEKRGESPGPKLIESKAGGCTEPDPVNPCAVDQSRL